MNLGKRSSGGLPPDQAGGSPEENRTVSASRNPENRLRHRRHGNHGPWRVVILCRDGIGCGNPGLAFQRHNNSQVGFHLVPGW